MDRPTSFKSDTSELKTSELTCSYLHWTDRLRDSNKIGFREAIKRASPLIVRTTDSERKEQLQSEFPFPADVEAYIHKHNLRQPLVAAQAALNQAFGYSVETRQRLSTDPEDGTEMLFVEIVASDLNQADGLLSSFNYNWWYDQIAAYGNLVGFRLLKKRAI